MKLIYHILIAILLLSQQSHLYASGGEPQVQIEPTDDFIILQMDWLQLTGSKGERVPESGGSFTFNARLSSLGESTPEELAEYFNRNLRARGFDTLLTVRSCSTSLSILYHIITVDVKANHSTRSRCLQIKDDGRQGYTVSIFQGGGAAPVNPGEVTDPNPEEGRQNEPDTDMEPVAAQDNETLVNWIKATTYTHAAGGYQDITYYNGLGYPKQIIQIGASANTGHNIVTPVMYDSKLRGDTRTYLPYVSGSKGVAAENIPVTAQAAWYASRYNVQESAPFARKVYEASSDRVLKQYNYGNVFLNAGKYASGAYLINTGNEVMKISVSGAGITVSGTYPAGSLYANRSSSEDGILTVSYVDKDGKTVLERGAGASGTHPDTYYVYNEKQELCWVIQPEGSKMLLVGSTVTPSSDLAQRYCYIYTYDGKGNLLTKQLSGRSVEYFVYDKGGRPVLYQDGNLRGNNRWIYTVYDNHNRPVEKSVITTALSRETLQNRYMQPSFDNTYPILGESNQIHVPFSTGECSLAYVLSSERYYGYSYRTALEGALPFESNTVCGTAELENNNNRGLKSGERLLILDANNNRYVTHSYFYDKQGRVIQVAGQRPQGIHRISFRYDYRGNVIQEQESYGSHTKHTARTYDIRGRLLSESTTLNGAAAGTVTYGYNELGQLTGKTYGNGVTENIAYNIQGWQTLQNVTRDGATLYSQELRYYDPVKGSTALYGGNISEWGTTHKGKLQNTYGFVYDNQGRLTSSNRYAGTAASPVSSYTERGITYDLNGNITALQRYNSVLQDNFLYTYTGNKLMGISGSIRAAYVYDNNGNMITDGRKNLQITYNVLNLPERVQANGVTVASYSYLADGSKYSVEDTNGNGYVYTGSLTYSKNPLNLSGGEEFYGADFAGGKILSASQGRSFQPVYYTTDHLGSIRVITDANGVVKEQNDYYPYGGRHTSGNIYALLPGNNHKFNGKEEQTTGNLGYLDYGARMYDNVTGRWGTPDPLAEKYKSLSPYNYCGNNPVINIDPDGRDWYRNTDGDYMWRKGTAATYVDDLSRIWRNSGESYTHYRNDGSSVFFYQQTNPAGEMTLASHTFSPNETAAFGLFHSNEAREAAMQDHINPTWGSFLSMVAKEMKAQWTDPYLLTAGATAFVQGITRGSSGNYGAGSSANARRLNLQLASEEQMMSKGTSIITTKELRNASRLARQYGGKPGDWVKGSSDSYKGYGIQFETHWYENQTTGLRVEFKTKIK